MMKCSMTSPGVGTGVERTSFVGSADGISLSERVKMRKASKMIFENRECINEEDDINDSGNDRECCGKLDGQGKWMQFEMKSDVKNNSDNCDNAQEEYACMYNYSSMLVEKQYSNGD